MQKSRDSSAESSGSELDLEIKKAKLQLIQEK